MAFLSIHSRASIRRGSSADRWCRAAIAAAALVALTHGGTADAEREQRVVALLPAHSQLSSERIARRIEASLDANGNRIEVRTELVELHRPPNPEHESGIVHTLHGKLAQLEADALIVVGPELLELVTTHRHAAFSRTPLIFAGVSAPGPTPLPPNATGVLTRFAPLGTLELALRLQPAARDVWVVSGASAVDVRYRDRARIEFARYDDRVHFHYLDGQPLAATNNALGRLRSDSIVVLLSMRRDGAGQHRPAAELARAIAAESAAPVYGVLDAYVGGGVVGGYVENPEAIGEEAAALALRVLRGEPAESIPPYEAGAHRIVMDARAAARWGLDVTQLRAGAEIRNAERSAWGEHGTAIALIAAAFLVQSMLVAALLVRNRKLRARHTLRWLEERHRAAAEVRADRELDRQREQVMHLTRVAILGQLAGALAHELRQPLTAILSNAQAAQRLLAREHLNAEALDAILEDIVADDVRAGEVIARLRSLLKRDEQAFAPLDINAVVRDTLALAHGKLVEHRVAVTVQLAPDLPPTRGDAAQLKQVLLNLLLNAVEAMSSVEPRERTIVVSTAQQGTSFIVVAVADSGEGISPEAAEWLFEPFHTTKPQGLGLGLAISQSIIAVHGGKLTGSNDAGRGATFVFTLPIHFAPAAVQNL